MNLSQVIIKPVLTEKSVRGELENKYTFIIGQKATKIDVKQAIKALFGATAIKVNIKKGMPKYRLGKGRRPMQKRPASRQAIITIKAGEKLDLAKLTGPEKATAKKATAKKKTATKKATTKKSE
jgi:large subunit ribosomal protein L23